MRRTALVLTAGVAPILDRVQRHRDQRGRCRERCCRAHVEIDARDNGDRRISVERPHVRRDEPRVLGRYAIGIGLVERTDAEGSNGTVIDHVEMQLDDPIALTDVRHLIAGLNSGRLQLWNLP